MSVTINGERVLESGVVLCNQGETILIGGSVDVRIEFPAQGTEGSNGVNPESGTLVCVAPERPQEKQWYLGFGAGLPGEEKIKMVHAVVENIFGDRKRVTYTVIEQSKPKLE